ncbi:MAG: DUF6807 family protein [Planctomycetaceae bacterium]
MSSWKSTTVGSTTKTSPSSREETRYTITPDRLIACELKLTAVGKPVTFGDTKEGLFAVRLEKNLREVASGRISECRGQTRRIRRNAGDSPRPGSITRARWKEKPWGSRFSTTPATSAPRAYHVRAYGLISINPFGERNYSKGQAEAQERTIQPERAVQLRYGLYVRRQPRSGRGPRTVPEIRGPEKIGGTRATYRLNNYSSRGGFQAAPVLSWMRNHHGLSATDG